MEKKLDSITGSRKTLIVHRSIYPLQQAAQAARHKFYKLPAEDILDEDVLEEKHASANLRAETLAEFPSKVLSNMFAVHAKLCDRKFELKINDVRFVGHPISLKVKPGEARNFARDIKSNITMFQVCGYIWRTLMSVGFRDIHK